MSIQKVIYGNNANKVINGNIVSVNMTLKIIEHPIYNNTPSYLEPLEQMLFNLKGSKISK